MSGLQQFVPAAKLLGLSSCSFLTAYIASFSITTVPALQAAPVSADDLAKQWNKAFKLGKATAPPFAITCASCFAFLAYQSRNIKGRLPISPFALYSAAAIVAPCIVPYTRIVMWPNITAIEAKAEGKVSAPGDTETKALVEKWSGQNTHRAYIAGTATLLSVVAMLA